MTQCGLQNHSGVIFIHIHNRANITTDQVDKTTISQEEGENYWEKAPRQFPPNAIDQFVCKSLILPLFHQQQSDLLRCVSTMLSRNRACISIITDVNQMKAACCCCYCYAEQTSWNFYREYYMLFNRNSSFTLLYTHIIDVN